LPNFIWLSWAWQIRWVCCRVDVFQVLDADVGVDLSRGDFCMAEQLLDAANVGAVFEHLGCGGVTEEVATATQPTSPFFAAIRRDS